MNPELLAAIRAAPGDDAPRLVYADWLLERGDRRGDLINAQCTRASCEAAGDFTSDRYRHALVEESAALRDVRVPWLRSLGVEPVANVAFVRGFPTALGATPAHFFARWADVAELPLTHLIFLQTDRPITVGDLRRLAGLAPAATLTTLALVKPGATAHLDLARVFEALPLASAELDEKALWPDGALAPIAPFGELTSALAHDSLATFDRDDDFNEQPIDYLPLVDGRPPFPSALRAITLSCEAINDESVIATNLRSAKQLRSLELVEVRERMGMAALDDWPHQGLKKLRLECPGRAVGQRFATSGAAKGLEHLAVSFPLDGVVAEALDAAALETMSVNGGHDVAALEHVLSHHPNLRELRLEGFRGDVAGALVRAAGNARQLSIVELRYIRVDFAKLAEWEQRLTSLSFHGCGDARPLLEAPAFASVPWIHAENANRLPAPYAFRYDGKIWP